MRGQNIKELYKSEGAQAFVGKLTEALVLGREGDKNGLKPSDFSLRELAEGILGRDGLEKFNPLSGSVTLSLAEAGGADAVDSTAFSNITGQIIYNKMLEDYNKPEYVGESLVENIPTKLSGEKIPGIGLIPDEAIELGEGEPYSRTEFGEDYINTPATTKKGLILEITKEAIFFDRTGLVLRRAGMLAERLRLTKEKKILRTVLGIDNSYSRKGVSDDTYQTTDWVNTQSNEMIDWGDIEDSEMLFAEMTDDNGEPILIGGTVVIVMPKKKYTARRILSATEVSTVNGTQTTVSGNPVDAFSLVVSPIAKQLLVQSGISSANADKYWYQGDFKRAFAYMENWPLTVVQASDNNEAEFARDIALRYKASEMGTPAVLDPHYVVQNTN